MSRGAYIRRAYIWGGLIFEILQYAKVKATLKSIFNDHCPIKTKGKTDMSFTIESHSNSRKMRRNASQIYAGDYRNTSQIHVSDYEIYQSSFMSNSYLKIHQQLKQQ